MKTFINKQSLSVLLLLLYTLALSACYREESKSLSSKTLTGEELVREIILIDGNTDKKIPEYSQVIEELNTLKPDEIYAKKIFNDYITEEVKKYYPDYFNKLSEAVYSKKLYALKQAFNDGRSAVINVIRLSNKYDGLLKSIEKFATLKQANYNINSKEDKDKFIDDLSSYLNASNQQVVS